MLSEQTKAEISQLRAKYPDARSVLMPALHLAQRDNGWLSTEVMADVGAFLGIPVAEVRSVASFYTMYRLKPVGKYHIQVCTNISCSLLGADHVVDYLKKKLGIEVGGTTPDKKCTLTTVECLGSCGTAPVMQVNDDYYESLTEQRIDEILNALK